MAGQEKSFNSNPLILLYDGECGFCSRMVQFVFKHDPDGLIHFAALQSKLGKTLLSIHNVDAKTLDTVVLIEQDRVYIKSEAALHTCTYLNNGLPLLGVFKIIPLKWRDYIYDAIARRRKNILKGNCPIPSAELKARMIG